MKINKNSLVLGLVVGIIIGGLAIGVLDANRLNPIFSSADGGCDELKAEMKRTADQINALHAEQGQNTYNNDAIMALLDYWLDLLRQHSSACTEAVLAEPTS
jgi:hypothetical protein